MAPSLLSQLVLRPVNDIALAVLQAQRRTEFLYRDGFDRAFRDPLFGLAQSFRNWRRPQPELALAEERALPDEERLTQQIIAELVGFVRGNWQPGGAQRFGNTKTYGIVRGEFCVRDGLPDSLRHGLFERPGSYPTWVRFSGPGPYAPPDLDDLGQCSVALKVMGVDGPKLLDDEKHTQDFLLAGAPICVTPDVVANAKLQRHVRARTPLWYFINPLDSHLVELAMQSLYSRAQANPLQVRYFSTTPYLLGQGQAVQYDLVPTAPSLSRVPARPSENYLREAMAERLRTGAWTFEFRVQAQTESRRMPVEDAAVKWPERLSPYLTVAQLRLPAQRFDSDAQLAFADRLSFNPWHSAPAHRPLGNSNRARRAVYQALSQVRQEMNAVSHQEPDGRETFGESGSGPFEGDGVSLPGRARRRAASAKTSEVDR
jgi:hypothetical protein